jgi:hypothetical protein
MVYMYHDLIALFESLSHEGVVVERDIDTGGNGCPRIGDSTGDQGVVGQIYVCQAD